MADALNPSAAFQERYGTNVIKERRINHCFWLEDKIIFLTECTFITLALRHDNFSNVELYVAAAKVKLKIEEPSELYFLQKNINQQISNPNNEAKAVK